MCFGGGGGGQPAAPVNPAPQPLTDTVANGPTVTVAPKDQEPKDIAPASTGGKVANSTGPGYSGLGM